jgi:hypothetical protein
MSKQVFKPNQGDLWLTCRHVMEGQATEVWCHPTEEGALCGNVQNSSQSRSA